MQGTRGRALGLLVAGLLALSACAGGDGDGSSSRDEDHEPSSGDKHRNRENACSPSRRAMLPDGADPESCWHAPGVSDPVIVGDTLFALAAPQGGEGAGDAALVAFDVATGERIWVSDPLPGQFLRMAATELGGDAAIGALVAEHDEGDAVTAESESWGYLAWPADVDGEAPAEPAVHITAPRADGTIFPEPRSIRWTDQGLLAGDRLLLPGAEEFVAAVVDPEPMTIGPYDLGESLVGVSGELMLSYVADVAWRPEGPEDGETHLGWLARGTDGSTAWDGVTPTPNQGDVALFAEGPARMPVVVGDHALVVVPTDETYSDFRLEWVESATGEPASPAPADLVGATPSGGTADIINGEVDSLLSPDGRYLFLQWSTLPVIVDVEAGTVERIRSDFEITGLAIDDTTLHARTDSGHLTVDLASAEATPLDAPRQAFEAIGGDHGALVDLTESDTPGPVLVVARREG